MDKATLHELIDAKYKLKDFLYERAPEIAKKLSVVDEWYYYKWSGFSLSYRVDMHDMSLEKYTDDEENWEPCVQCCTEDREGDCEYRYFPVDLLVATDEEVDAYVKKLLKNKKKEQQERKKQEREADMEDYKRLKKKLGL